MTVLKVGETKNRYQILEEIGSGGFSVVYRAEDTLNRLGEVAIKEFVLTQEEAERFGEPWDKIRKRFRDEAYLTQELQHPHIIEIYDIFENPDCIVMPYMPETLASRLGVDHCLDTAEAITIMLQVCKGLAHIHNHKLNGYPVVHCDIKPGNILFDPAGEVKISDFGIAHVHGQGKTVEFNVGTVEYMPPEQIEGRRDLPQIDVYAVGSLFYRILTGRHYMATRSFEPLRAHDVPQPLIDIIEKALQTDYNARYADAGEMLLALEASQQEHIAKLHIQAYEAYFQKDWDKADELFTQMLAQPQFEQLSKDNPQYRGIETKQQITYFYVQAGQAMSARNFRHAKQVLQELLEVDPDQSPAREMLRKAENYLWMQRIGGFLLLIALLTLCFFGVQEAPRWLNSLGHTATPTLHPPTEDTPTVPPRVLNDVRFTVNDTVVENSSLHTIPGAPAPFTLTVAPANTGIKVSEIACSWTTIDPAPPTPPEEGSCTLAYTGSEVPPEVFVMVRITGKRENGVGGVVNAFVTLEFEGVP